MGKKILVYTGKGISTYYLRHLVRWLRKYLAIIDPQTSCERVDADYLLFHPDWEKHASVLIIPGGADIPYHQALSGLGTQRILNFIYKGGRYLGICAGAYFGASKIRFYEPDGSLLEASRDLCFFPGTAVGPAYQDLSFSYIEPSGVRVANLFFTSSQRLGKALFNGGCYFEHAEIYPEITVEACYYDLPNQPACIVSRQYGEGEVILSGAHIEYLPEYCNLQALNVRQARESIQQDYEILDVYTMSLISRLCGIYSQRVS